jgi:glycerol-3-phosphate acyltransferase PlsX
MRKKIRGGPTTQKHRKTTRAALIAAKCDSLTGFVLLAATMATEPLRKNKPLPLSEIVIGVDLMGSDCPPPIILDALASLNSPVRLLAIGTPEYKKQSPLPFHPAVDFIAMDENPLTALRRKKESSLCVGLRLLKEGKIHALVSAGNTGALVTGAKMILSMLPHILRPALLAMLPTKKQPVAVLDVGANVRVKTSHLIQFALMGAAYLQTRDIERPHCGSLMKRCRICEPLSFNSQAMSRAHLCSTAKSMPSSQTASPGMCF